MAEFIRRSGVSRGETPTASSTNENEVKLWLSGVGLGIFLLN